MFNEGVNGSRLRLGNIFGRIVLIKTKRSTILPALSQVKSSRTSSNISYEMNENPFHNLFKHPFFQFVAFNFTAIHLITNQLELKTKLVNRPITDSSCIHVDSEFEQLPTTKFFTISSNVRSVRTHSPRKVTIHSDLQLELKKKKK